MSSTSKPGPGAVNTILRERITKQETDKAGLLEQNAALIGRNAELTQTATDLAVNLHTLLEASRSLQAEVIRRERLMTLVVVLGALLVAMRYA